MTMSNLSEAELIASAGGDPWAINQSLQAGSPFQISQLAEAFHGAGRHTAEADHAFERENASPPPGTIRMVATPSTTLKKCSG